MLTVAEFLQQQGCRWMCLPVIMLPNWSRNHCLDDHLVLSVSQQQGKSSTRAVRMAFDQNYKKRCCLCMNNEIISFVSQTGSVYPKLNQTSLH